MVATREFFVDLINLFCCPDTVDLHILCPLLIEVDLTQIMEQSDNRYRFILSVTSLVRIYSCFQTSIYIEQVLDKAALIIPVKPRGSRRDKQVR